MPNELRNLLVWETLQKLESGRLGTHLYRTETSDGIHAYLKVGTGDTADDLHKEKQRLEWIGSRIPIPEVLYFGMAGEILFLLISEIKGRPSYEYCTDTKMTEKIIELLATSLRAVHDIPIADCPFQDLLDREFKQARLRIEENLLDESTFYRGTDGLAPRKVLALLEEQRSIVKDFVFTHGDYCLPNVVLDSEKLFGIVDWETAAVADLHRDFMCIEKSIRRNCGHEWVQLFYNAYGFFTPDQDRIRFYWLLDQFDQAYSPRSD